MRKSCRKIIRLGLIKQEWQLEVAGRKRRFRDTGTCGRGFQQSFLQRRIIKSRTLKLLHSTLNLISGKKKGYSAVVMKSGDEICAIPVLFWLCELAQNLAFFLSCATRRWPGKRYPSKEYASGSIAGWFWLRHTVQTMTFAWWEARRLISLARLAAWEFRTTTWTFWGL